jgi:hypothetical protein
MTYFSPEMVKRLRNNVSDSINLFGHSVILRKYISASAGNPDLQIADKLCYQERPTRMDVAQITLEEAQAMGGFDIRGTYKVLAAEKVEMLDEIICDGETYRVLSLPDDVVVGSPLSYSFLMQRASITGFYK